MFPTRRRRNSYWHWGLVVARWPGWEPQEVLIRQPLLQRALLPCVVGGEKWGTAPVVVDHREAIYVNPVVKD